MRFSIFYHLYLVNDWRRIFINHLFQLSKAGCLSECRSMNIGITYVDKAELDGFSELFSEYSPFTILFTRQAASRLRRKVNKHPLLHRVFGSKLYELPCQLKDGSYVKTNMEYGESETILYMAHLAHEMHDVDRFLFLHSKGATRPVGYEKPGIGKHPELVRLSDYIGFIPLLGNEAGNAITSLAIDKYINDWRVNGMSISPSGYHYLMWNIFWIGSRLLRQFSLVNWLDPEYQMCLHPRDRPGPGWGLFCEGMVHNRHLFGNFPVKLHAMVNQYNIDHTESVNMHLEPG